MPSRDGFAFPNTWPPAPAVTVPTPLGRIGMGNAARGLCGGMIFAALDYWYAGLAPPPDRPTPETPLYRFIVRRLLESWNMPSGAATYYAWMALPDHDGRLSSRGRTIASWHGVWMRTVDRQWPLVRASIDRGEPAPLGLVTMASANPGVIGRNHQVLAYRYQLAGTQVTVNVYDPNSGRDDRVSIAFDEAAGPATFAHNVKIRWPVRGFFLTAYSPAIPPAS